MSIIHKIKCALKMFFCYHHPKHFNYDRSDKEYAICRKCNYRINYYDLNHRGKMLFQIYRHRYWRDNETVGWERVVSLENHRGRRS